MELEFVGGLFGTSLIGLEIVIKIVLDIKNRQILNIINKYTNKVRFRAEASVSPWESLWLASQLTGRARGGGPSPFQPPRAARYMR